MSRFPGSKAIVYAALIFLAGGVIGAVIATVVARHYFLLPPRSDRMTATILDRLTNRLGLTDSEVTEIRPIVEETGRQMAQIHTETMQRVDKIMDDGNKRMSEFLTPEQRQKLTEMEAERRQRILSMPPPGHFFGPPPSGSPPGPPPSGMHDQ